VLGWLLLAPALTMLAAFVLVPMVLNVVISFQDRTLTTPEWDWVGLDNWRLLLEDGSLRSVVQFTALYTAVTVTGAVALGLACALALFDRPWLRRVVGTLILLPLATSLVIAAAGWRLVFDLAGVLNEALRAIGVDGPNWLNEPRPAQAAVIIVGLWAQVGFSLLLYQAALAQVPGSLVDAARLYGSWRGIAVKARLFVPLMRRTTVVCVVISTIIAIRAFDQVYALTQGGPFGESRTLAYLSWEQSFQFFNLGAGAAASSALVALVLVVTALELAVLGRTRRRR